MKKSELMTLAGIGFTIWLLNKTRGHMAGLNNAARPSCLECTEKHLSSAAVLDCEVNSGYPEHRMYIIGHLNEASDESLAWPELSNAIRQARKNYQQDGVCPDYKALYALAEKYRTGN